ncbi:hypothetical protein NLK61_00600 [Pseudomonas fuscovaginae UPB0736]|uniref:hypothetical protein n=1 Tax=Pseudomonas asplenii TaxID=53407 RepID=UPI000287A663|nr:hypothetical protein [Pseudomonas fuscovaginae]UUQ65186.1 hypothetical protein NLK61_00600 [Pseudomonas fuscovaginae UPB0736]
MATKLALVIYIPGKPEQDILLKGPGVDADEVLNTLSRRGGLSLDGDNDYKLDVCDVIVGVLASGKQNSNPPPEGHWGQRFYDIGQAEGELQEKLLSALQQVTDCLALALTGGSVPAADADKALATAGELLKTLRT